MAKGLSVILAAACARGHNCRVSEQGASTWKSSPTALASSEDAVAVAPADENIDRPHPRPVHARCSLEEGAPETLHRGGVKSDRSDGLWVPQRLVHGVLQSTADPAIQWQHEAALRPLEQCGVQAAQADAPQHGLA